MMIIKILDLILINFVFVDGKKITAAKVFIFNKKLYV